MLRTTHSIVCADSRALKTVKDESIDLVVTSPPYPMIEMWDELYARIDPDIGRFLEREDRNGAFEAMHRVLDGVWQELYRVMKSGAFACINIGDATRRIGNRFQLFANHSRIQQKFCELGFDALPVIIWRKQTNAPNKFMGSGMLPAGAYVTLEHEFILIFRKDAGRSFRSADEKSKRMQSGYFWEERNTWFSDLWDFKGIRQQTGESALRERSAAYPLILPFRLINMYSLIGDTVLDPFLGTGTTTLAAMAAGRNSVGYEIDVHCTVAIKNKIQTELPGINNYNLQRLNNHLLFIREYTPKKGCSHPFKYTNDYYGFPVMTRQERGLKLPLVKSYRETEESIYEVSYLDDEHIRCSDLEHLFNNHLFINEHRICSLE